MIRIWARTTIDNKVLNSMIYESDEDFSVDSFDSHIHAICEKFDIPAPILMIKHYKNFIMFNSAIFNQDDFVEKVYFEKLILTNAPLD